MGVALTWADSELTVVSANHAFEAWIPPQCLPLEAKPWRALWPSAELDRLAEAAQEVIRTAEPRRVSGGAITGAGSGALPPVWGAELRPVTDGAGPGSHLCGRDSE